MTTQTQAVTVCDLEWDTLLERDRDGDVPVVLTLDPQERTVDIEAIRSDGTPMDIYHGVRRSYRVACPGVIDGPALVEWLRSDKGQALLARICDGHRVEWDGSNHVGRLTPDAAEASESLVRELADAPSSDTIGGIWDAGDWLQACPPAVARATDAELDKLEADLAADARADGVVVHGLRAYLEDLRTRQTE